MNKKSIYVSIPCLGFDNELMTTVNTCISNSSKDNDIRIHIACTGNKDFYNMTLVQTTNFKNVDISFFQLEGNYGIGKGRKHAAEKYNGEDYFLEIDAHTYFDKDWDNILINKLEKAILFSKNEKTVITSYLPSYKSSVDGYEIQHMKMPFMQWSKNETIISTNSDTGKTEDTKIPKWLTVDSLNNKEKWSSLQEVIKDVEFVPSIKVCGQFIFGNKNFGEGTRLDEKTLFWEEEVLQSIELLNDGFSILYPNMDAILHHHSQNQGSTTSRITFYQLCRDIGIDAGEYLGMMRSVYQNYILDPENQEKIEKFNNYSKINLKTNCVISTTINKDI
jgi:hypothetical protein